MYSYDSGMLAAIAGFLGVIAVILVVCLIIGIIATWKIFTKAGEEGWKCLIPFYNQYTLYKITWDVTYFWVILGLSVVGAIVGALEIPVIGSILSIASAVIGIIQLHKMSKAYGHDIGFTLGLIFLSPIFFLILAFGQSEYMGPQ